MSAESKKKLVRNITIYIKCDIRIFCFNIDLDSLDTKSKILLHIEKYNRFQVMESKTSTTSDI